MRGMTSFSPPAVHICPGCNLYFLHSQLRSINFNGVRNWSDSAPTAWWRREPLVRCSVCAALFWMDDIEPIATWPECPEPMGRLARTVARWRGDPHGRLQKEREYVEIIAGWKHPRYIGHADFDDVVYVLSRSRGLSRERILWLRKRIWWGLNDRFRNQGDMPLLPCDPAWPQAAERTNMEVILAMLEDDRPEPSTMLLQGELLRLLGRFDEAVAILKAVLPDGFSEVRAGRIQQLAARGDRQVRELLPLSLSVPFSSGQLVW